MTDQADGGVIGITGASGKVGRRVAERLAKRGLPLRLIVRDESRAPKLPTSTVAVASDYTDRPAMVAALSGVSTMLLVSAHEGGDRVQVHKAAIDAGVEAGVQRIVYLSFLNAAPDATFILARDHYHTEQAVRATGLDFTLLRNSLYADVMPGFFGKDGVVRGPAGDGRISVVTRDDIADVAAVVLADPSYNGQTINNTGPEALSFTEMAAILTEITERPCRFYDETMDEARQSRSVYGAPEKIVDGWISTYTAVKAGELDFVGDDVRRITGHAPLSFREFLARYPQSYAHLVDSYEPR
ncbi:MAG: SDR family oxidoreductase [Chloroflexi bacterium]|nr:SDR family oxidoreductase [Chloroflexota bacterium]